MNLSMPRPCHLPLLLLSLALLGFPAFAAEEAQVSMQAVQASEQGQNAEKPEIDASLSAYSDLLKNQGFGKYKDIGKDSGAGAAGAAIKLSAGGYAVEITVVKAGKKGATLKYVIKQAGKEIGQSTITLAPGEATPVQVGNQKSPVILLFKLER